MAAGGDQSFEEEFLSCSICTEIYIDPCTLRCQHSFCRKCVSNFIQTRPDAIQSKTIPCAFCRQDTPVPKPTRPAEEWAGQLKPSLMLQGLMDRHQRDHRYKGGKDLCFLCKEVGETTPASSWCSDCEVTLCGRCAKMHLKGPATNKHDLFDLSEGDEATRRRKAKCKQHVNEQIKVICRDCKKAVCQTCCILKHAKHNIVTIESMIPEIKSALTEKRCNIQKKMIENMANVRNEESMIQQLKATKTRIGSEIKSAINTAICLLREKEGTLLSKLDEISDNHITEHQANVKSGQITNQMYQQHCEFIDQTLQSESDIGMYEMYQVCLSGAVESVEDTDSNNRDTPFAEDVKFTPKMEPLTKAITEMGEVDVSASSRELALPVARKGSNHSRTALSTDVLHDIIKINHSADSNDPNPIDVSCLTVNGDNIIVIADISNKCLKATNVTKNRRVIHRLKLSCSPLRIAVLPGNLVAATVLDSSVLLAEVRPELVFITSLKTTKQYYGLAQLPDSNLAAGSMSPPAVDILDLNGNVLKSHTPNSIGLELLILPEYLSTTKQGNILVCDASKSVYCLTPKGDVVFICTFTGIRQPAGITVTDSGDILLADELSETIIQLTSYGTFVRYITAATGVCRPRGLCVGENEKLYVCNRASRNNCIKEFNLT